jgi:hypothetical protein
LQYFRLIFDNLRRHTSVVDPKQKDSEICGAGGDLGDHVICQGHVATF